MFSWKSLCNFLLGEWSAQVASTKQSLIALDFFGDGITREAIKDMIMSFVIDVSSCDSKMIVRAALLYRFLYWLCNDAPYRPGAGIRFRGCIIG